MLCLYCAIMAHKLLKNTTAYLQCKLMKLYFSKYLIMVTFENGKTIPFDSKFWIMAQYPIKFSSKWNNTICTTLLYRQDVFLLFENGKTILFDSKFWIMAQYPILFSSKWNNTVCPTLLYRQDAILVIRPTASDQQHQNTKGLVY